MELAELSERIAQAAAKGTSLEVLGSGSKRGIGKPAKASAQLEMKQASGIIDYEPEELVFTALAGTSRMEAERALRKAGQMFAFEPPDFSRLMASASSGTLGGMAASNLSGPRRLKAGAVRDHVLGFAGVTGGGEAYKAGGRVVKNVTGYDLPKLVSGSWGTLSVLHSITFKVLPRPESELSLVIHGLSASEAVQAMSAAMGSAAEVSGAAHMPETRETILRIEGITPSLFARRVMMENVVKRFGELSVLPDSASNARWAAIRDADVLKARPEEAVWRCSVAPMDGPRLMEAVPQARGFYDWAGGLVWLALTDKRDAGASDIHSAVKVLGGHAMLVRASEATRARVACRTPEAPALAALSARVKSALDPQGILNPGRME